MTATRITVELTVDDGDPDDPTGITEAQYTYLSSALGALGMTIEEIYKNTPDEIEEVYA